MVCELFTAYFFCSHASVSKRKAEDDLNTISDKKRLKQSHSNSPDPDKKTIVKKEGNPVPFPEKVSTLFWLR